MGVIRTFAKSLGCTPAQFRPACMLHSKTWIVPIRDTAKFPPAVENCGGATVRLTDKDMALIGKAAEGLEFFL